MFGIGMPELLVILLIALIVFGAGKLPSIGMDIGKAIRGFKKGLSESDAINLPKIDLPKKEEEKDKHTNGVSQ